MLARARTFTSESARARAFARKTLLLRGARERGLRHRYEQQVSGQRERKRERHTRKNTHTHASTHSGLNHTEPDIFETAHIYV